MADVLLLCVHADAKRAVVLAEELEIAGFSVEGASAGRAAIEACAASVLVWTRASMESGIFLDAAQGAAVTGKVIVANFTGAPHPWRRATDIDMARWDGDPDDVAVDLLINAVMRRAASKLRVADFAHCYVAMRGEGAIDEPEDAPAGGEPPPAPVIELAPAKSDPFHAEKWLFGPAPPRRVDWRGRAALSAVVAAAVMLTGSFLVTPNQASTLAAAAYAAPLEAPAPALDSALSLEDMLADAALDAAPPEAAPQPRFGREPASAPAQSLAVQARPTPVRVSAPLQTAPARAPRLTPISAVIAAPNAPPTRIDADWLNRREAARLRALWEDRSDLGV